ncbi:hypothetical protein IQ10_01316 [Halalkalibacter nanhaiisediminis]|uniref:Uncharacterized protein n=1 Tax=Halalkalibacter nanhaiisediminis TaxID=688079 RepID=A0A562QMR3_9BACI|nr:hypothetical protein IQ10_01316 [Halalkalibacter nanhaiisediminis]
MVNFFVIVVNRAIRNANDNDSFQTLMPITGGIVLAKNIIIVEAFSW